MKKLMTAALSTICAMGMLYGNAAFATDTTVCEVGANCKVDTIRLKVTDNIARIYSGGMGALPAGCGPAFAITIDTEVGQAIYSAALTAKATGADVFIALTDTTKFDGDQCLISEFRLL